MLERVQGVALISDAAVMSLVLDLPEEALEDKRLVLLEGGN
jgi:hypothetical protein